MLRTVLRLVIRKRFDPKVQYIFISMWWFHHDLGIVSTMVCQCSHRNTQNAQSTDQRGFLKQKNQEQMCSCAICGKNSSPLKRQFKRWRTICNKYHLMRTLGAPRHSNSFKTELHKLAMKAMIKRCHFAKLAIMRKINMGWRQFVRILLKLHLRETCYIVKCESLKLSNQKVCAISSYLFGHPRLKSKRLARNCLRKTIFIEYKRNIKNWICRVP